MKSKNETSGIANFHTSNQGAADAPKKTTAAQGRILGYARVSARDQNEARQIDSLERYGVDAIYIDKRSGKDFDRPNYKRLMEILGPEDTLVIKSIDRLGRNYTEILNQWRRITRDIGADVVVIDMPLLDTRQSHDLTGRLISDIVLQLLSYVAETERSFIKQRQAEGIAAAKARGKRLGRPCIERGPGFPELAARWRRGEINASEAGRQLGVSHVTFLKWVREGAKQAPNGGERSPSNP